MTALPLRLIPAGFAINTLFYAAILWGGWLLFAVRRHLRIKRGPCPACAYPIGESEVCTECGKPVKAKHQHHQASINRGYLCRVIR